MSAHQPIVIVGAGIGGLTAARVLHTHGIESVIVEREPDRQARVQGGMLDIHEESGQQAIHAAMLWDEFTRLIHRGGEAMRILDAHGTVLRDQRDDGQLSRPEVDRGQLRDMLIDSLPGGAIRWGHKVVSIQALEAGYRIEFDDQEAITTDLLIGADGAWSKVRPLLTDAWPAYTGISFIEADLVDASDRHPTEAAAMGDGMLFALQGNTGILGHRETDGSLHVYLGLRVDESWIDTIDWADTPGAKREVLARLDGWDGALRGLIENADTGLTPRRIHALPVGVSWPRVPGVTLLGDAAHVMSPFAGEGANLAMFDAARLAQRLAEHRDDVETALAAYEAELFPRSAQVAVESAQNLDVIFSDDSPAGLVRMFEGFDDERAAAQDSAT